MKVASGVEMLEITANILGEQSTIHPTLIWDENEVILIDTGYPGQLPLFRAEIEKAGVPFDSLDKVILTHQDIDHIGSLPGILAESSHKIEVLASEIEKPYIQGEKRLIKLSPEALAKIDELIPPHVPDEWRKAFKAILENPPASPVDRTVADGEDLPFCGGIVGIDTPGHTPGHISLYHKQSKTLIAGDALGIVDGQLIGPEPQYTLDMAAARKSLKKLMEYDIQSIICYHGGLYNKNANQRIAELAQSI
ncbi:MBL fold metallo-hydrolase [Brevibacillus sp. SYSU BS000544]|uniref:MBL fold metallo-hydrolase n=1 Tax=Brevibacillus sp. SYSU BS000544 TaxID=3416443 RepID=UPI003CE4D727